MQDSQPRGVIEVNKCLSIKGAEDRVNKAHAFEVSTVEESMFFIADSDKARAQTAGPACCLEVMARDRQSRRGQSYNVLVTVQLQLFPDYARLSSAVPCVERVAYRYV